MRRSTFLGSLIVLTMLSMSLVRATTGPYRVCGHVPITGAAPIPHHEDRFGQFYFDYVNTELGGVDGHPVEFTMIDDRFYPGGAREALDTCKDLGASLLVGPGGHDQIVFGARWAEENQLPYLHGSVAARDVEGLTWSAFLAPTDEDLMHGLARSMASEAPPSAVFGLVRIDSRYYESGSDAFAESLADFGFELSTVVSAPKHERQFSRVWSELRQGGVTHVVLHITALMASSMLRQMPLGYKPRFGSIENTVSSSSLVPPPPNSSPDARILALHDPGPPFVESDLGDPTLPWRDQILEFRRIFETYSPEQRPPVSSFDWDSYLRAKQIHRFLDALDQDLSPEHIRSMFSTYTEAVSDVSPACALDFDGTPGVGGHAAHAFELGTNRWNLVASCVDDGVDIGGPIIDCTDEVPVVVDQLKCDVMDQFSGVGSVSGVDLAVPPPGGTFAVVLPPCSPQERFSLDLQPGVHRIQLTLVDCVGNGSSAIVNVVAL